MLEWPMCRTTSARSLGTNLPLIITPTVLFEGGGVLVGGGVAGGRAASGELGAGAAASRGDAASGLLAAGGVEEGGLSPDEPGVTGVAAGGGATAGVERSRSVTPQERKKRAAASVTVRWFMRWPIDEIRPNQS